MVAETRAKKALHAIQAKHPVDKRRITGASKQQDDRLQMLFDAFTLKRPELTMGVKWPKRDTIDSEESNHLFHHDQTNNPELDKEDRMNERIYTFLSKADYPFQPEKPKQRKWREKHTMMGNSSHWERTSGTTTHLATTRPVCKVPFFAAPPEDILLLAKTLHKDIHLNTTSYTKRWQRERRAFCRPSEEARLTPTPTPTPTSSTASTCSTVSTVSAPTTPTTTSSVHSQEKRQRKAVQEQEAEDHFFYAMQDFIIQQLPPLVSADACQEYGYNMIVDYLTRTCGQKMDDVLYSMTGRGEGVDHSVPLPIPERLDWKYMLLKLQQNGFPVEVLEKVQKELMEATKTEETVIDPHHSDKEEVEEADDDLFLTETEALFKAGIQQLMEEETATSRDSSEDDDDDDDDDDHDDNDDAVLLS